MKILKSLVCAIPLIALASCMQEYDVYNDNKQPESAYFDFSTSKDTKLTLDYGFTGYSFLFEVYTQNPFDSNYNRVEGLNPAYKAYTDKNSSFNGEVTLPAYVKTIYVCSDAVGVPTCIELQINNGSASYRYEPLKATTKAVNPTQASISIGSNKRTLIENKLYALYDTYQPSSGDYQWQSSNSRIKDLYTTVSNEEQLSGTSTMGQLLDRINSNLTKKDNSELICSEKDINISIKTEVNGEPVDGVHLDLVYLKSSASMHNAIAYYYYKTNAVMTPAAIKALPKFVVLPRTTSNNPEQRIKVRLQYFGENGLAEEGTDLFPAGYTIGYMLISDMFPSDGNSLYWAQQKTVESRITWALGINQTVYSNESANNKQRPGCISLYDKDAERIIIGFEDHAFHDSQYDDHSYEDVLFYIDADPMAAINTEKKPTISDDEVETFTTETTYGTYSFEDVWPSGGDYDLNDVMIEYRTDVTFNQKNEIKKIVDTFTPVHNGAYFKNAFGYVIKNSAYLGSIDRTESDFAALEESNQIILFEDVKQAVDQAKSKKVVRNFSSNFPKKEEYKRDYNPFIAVNYQANVKNRIEVHLPKEQATSWANLKKQNQEDDAYYINKNGKYPFAIQLEGTVNFKPVSETATIGSTDEYPYFNAWVESNGQTNTDWFLHKTK